MAFDLNKKDDSKHSINSSNGEGTSRFDLSKHGDAGTYSVADKQKPKSAAWIALAVILIGGGIWYFMSNSKKDDAVIAIAVTDTDSIKSEEVANHTYVDTVQKYAEVLTGNESGSSKSDSLKVVAAAGKAEASNTSSASPETQKDNAENNRMTAGTSTASTTKGNKVIPSNNTSRANKIPVTFGKASSTIKSLNNSIINKLVSLLEKNPNSSIAITGYASSEGELAVNQAFSQARAESFKNYLISKGITAERITTIGKGIENPVASNDSEIGRSKNRRVEVSVQ